MPARKPVFPSLRSQSSSSQSSILKDQLDETIHGPFTEAVVSHTLDTMMNAPVSLPWRGCTAQQGKATAFQETWSKLGKGAPFSDPSGTRAAEQAAVHTPLAEA